MPTYNLEEIRASIQKRRQIALEYLTDSKPGTVTVSTVPKPKPKPKPQDTNKPKPPAKTKAVYPQAVQRSYMETQEHYDCRLATKAAQVCAVAAPSQTRVLPVQATTTKPARNWSVAAIGSYEVLVARYELRLQSVQRQIQVNDQWLDSLKESAHV